MSEKTLEIHRLGDHVLRDGTPTPSGTDRAVCAGKPESAAQADTLQHVPERTQPDQTTGSSESA